MTVLLAKQFNRSNTLSRNLVEQSFTKSAPLSIAIKKKSEIIDDFVNLVWPYAQQAAYALKLDPKILLAQIALETGWGKFVTKDIDGSSSNNLFNIKSKMQNDSVQIKTTEYIANTAIQINASFKKYPSIKNSFNDYISLIKNDERYEVALEHSANPERYLDELYRAGYATDPQYVSKILSIYYGNDLQQALLRNGFK